MLKKIVKKEYLYLTFENPLLIRATFQPFCPNLIKLEANIIN
jgi:hypothetical protein